MIHIAGMSLPQVEYPGVRTRIYPHQAMMLAKWNEVNSFLLVTKTGSGKTAAAALPLIHYRQSGVFVYPTNELIKDQVRSITGLMDREGVSYRILSPENIDEKYGRESFHLLAVDAEQLKKFASVFRMSEKNWSAALVRLMKPERPKIILIHPAIASMKRGLKGSKTLTPLIG